MKKLLAGAAAVGIFVGMSGVASAADMSVSEMVETDWTGFYLGTNVGWGEANISGCIECDANSRAVADALGIDGLTTGIHGGYNWQSSNIIFGIEADVNFNPNGWDAYGATDSDDEWQTASVDVLGSIRGRLGLASGNAQYYLTGGVAMSDAEWVSTRDGNVDTAEFNDIGGVVGAGLELKVSEHMSIRGEGLYYFFNDSVNVDDFYEGDSDESVELENIMIFRVGASWHL